jgi:hypothetical protein
MLLNLLKIVQGGSKYFKWKGERIIIPGRERSGSMESL